LITPPGFDICVQAKAIGEPGIIVAPEEGVFKVGLTGLAVGVGAAAADIVAVILQPVPEKPDLLARKIISCEPIVTPAGG